MKKRLLSALSLVLAIALTFAVTACAERLPQSDDGSDNETGRLQVEIDAFETDETDEASDSDATAETSEPVDVTDDANADDSEDAEDTEDTEEAEENEPAVSGVGKKIRWLSWYEIDGTSPEAVLFKEKYGVPGESDGEQDGKIFDFIRVNYAERYTDLARMIVSGDSPDMFPFEINNFPYSIYCNMFQPIDGVIDLSLPEWDDTREAIETFKWNGGRYCPITALETADVLWYRDSVVKKAGLWDPYELYQKGQWDWDAFMEMCEVFSDPGNGKYCIDGWLPQDCFIGTTGSGLIGYDNGKLVSNLRDGSIERVMDLLEKLCYNDYRYPRHELNDWMVNYSSWSSGDTLFLSDGAWAFEDKWRKYRDKDGWGDNEISFVPFPKDPNTSKHYQLFKQNSYMLVTGAENIDGYKAWIECVLETEKNPDVKAQIRERKKADYGWTDKQLDLLEDIVTDLTPVFDFKNGIGMDIADYTIMDCPIGALTGYSYIGYETYARVREEFEEIINKRIDEINAAA